jgi:hypothetical protein
VSWDEFFVRDEGSWLTFLFFAPFYLGILLFALFYFGLTVLPSFTLSIDNWEKLTEGAARGVPRATDALRFVSLHL